MTDVFVVGLEWLCISHVDGSGEEGQKSSVMPYPFNWLAMLLITYSLYISEQISS